MVGYGQKWRLSYNLTFPIGLGVAVELAECNNGYRHVLTYSDGSKERSGMNDFMWILNPVYFHFWEVGLKATYICTLGPRAFIQPEMGLNFSFYSEHFSSFTYEDYVHERFYYLYVDNERCIRKLCPDLSFGINFLLHTKRDPRNNFVLGINANIGYVLRYKGYYSLQEPFTENVKNAEITIGSSYLGLSLGYKFISVPKLYDKKKYKEQLEYRSFDPEKTIHSLSVTFSNGMSFFGRISRQSRGMIYPYSSLSYTPEFEFKYNVTFPKGWGLSVGVPVGLFRRVLNMNLHNVVPDDIVWDNGTVGSNTSDVQFRFFSAYAGITLKASYYHDIHRNIFIQPELGIKILPFVHPVSYWDFDGDLTAYIHAPLNSTAEDIPYMKFEPEIQGKSYFIPQLICAVNFLVHGKNPRNNFVFGLNATIDFSKRMIVNYYSAPDFPSEYNSFGAISWNMSYVGLHLGYQFSLEK